jgi:trigger factor|tara:strand:+ start:55 stop:1461 length:1407 start_codon:yes stop_codon:yes gene_type:complete
MKVTIDTKKGLKTVLKVFVDKKTIEEKINIRLLELSKTASIKGFRPGKVPTAVLKTQFGKPIYGEVLEKILKETSTEALEEKKIKPAGQPKLDLKSYGEGKDLNYTLEVDELPSVKLKPLENVKFTEYEIKVSDSEIKKRIDDIASNQSNFKDQNEIEPAINGNLIIFDYEATIENKKFEGSEGKNTQIVLGKDLFIKGFDKQLLGIKKNQTREINVVLPENYPKKEFANKKAIFKCKIKNIKKSVPIKIDDEFAKNLGAKDLNDLKILVTKQVQNQYKMNLDAVAKESILDQLEKLHNIEIPENLIEQELLLITQNLKKEDIEKNKKESEKIARKRVKLGLILNEFGAANKLKVEEHEIKNEIQKQIQSMPGQQKQVLEYYQKNPSAASSLRGSIYEEKILNLIKTKSKQTKKIISSDEVEKILKSDHDKRHNHDHKHSKENSDKTTSQKAKKSVKSPKIKKKIRKK